MARREQSRWFPLCDLDRRPERRLFCFPPAGVGATFYHGWDAAFPPGTQTCAVELPGKLSRLREPHFQDIDAAVTAILERLTGMLDAPFALFGYSMGALLAFETARAVQKRFGVSPTHLLVAAANPPHLFEPELDPDGISDDALREKVAIKFGSFTNVTDPDLSAIACSILRGDLRLMNRYKLAAEPRLLSPITALRGAEDKTTPEPKVEAWATLTEARFKHEVYTGGHFFIHEQRRAVLDTVAEALWH